MRLRARLVPTGQLDIHLFSWRGVVSMACLWNVRRVWRPKKKAWIVTVMRRSGGFDSIYVRAEDVTRMRSRGLHSWSSRAHPLRAFEEYHVVVHILFRR